MNIQLSDNFRKKTLGAIFSIVVFIIVYIMLLILAIMLTALCAYGGIMLIVNFPKFITILLGIGLASIGIIILFFLFKFLFKEHSVDRSHLEEITSKDYPRLFGMIEEIVVEVGTKFPKKVYMSSDVNAAVFYDSSFWSMFFPISKNLQIGMGLVNTVTEQELKAILAHEFGHFSQRSMSVGSYVYNVNQVIYNMLYENESFDKMISGWASITGYFSIFVIIAVKVIQGIQWVLRKLYDYVNLKHLALSREMEFHADQVAANVAGSLALQESLVRLDLAQHAYNLAINFYEKKSDDKIISENLYQDQLFVLDILVKENNTPLKNNLPLVALEDLRKYNKSKLNVDDQWASHPTTEERVNALIELNITKDSVKNNLAIDLFSNDGTIEKKMTVKVFYYSTFDKDVRRLTIDEFKKEFIDDYNKNTFPKQYNGYYDEKNIIPFDLSEITDFSQIEAMDRLFAKEKVDMVYSYISIEADRNTLNNIYTKKVPIKRFEYDGKKYMRKEVGALEVKLDAEMQALKAEIKKNDIAIYRFFYNQAKIRGIESELKTKYITLFDEDMGYEKKFQLFSKFTEQADSLGRATSDEQVEDIFREFSELEIILKQELKQFLKKNLLAQEITKTMNDNLSNYFEGNWSYSKNPDSDQEYLDTMFQAVNYYYYFISRSYFLSKRDLLDFQIALLAER